MFHKAALIALLVASTFDPCTVFAAKTQLKIPPWYQCHRLKHSCYDACVDTKTGRVIDLRLWC
jgi:hypothetical protein